MHGVVAPVRKVGSKINQAWHRKVCQERNEWGCPRTLTAAAIPMRLLRAVKDRFKRHQANHFREYKYSHWRC